MLASHTVGADSTGWSILRDRHRFVHGSRHMHAGSADGPTQGWGSSTSSRDGAAAQVGGDELDEHRALVCPHRSIVGRSRPKGTPGMAGLRVLDRRISAARTVRHRSSGSVTDEYRPHGSDRGGPTELKGLLMRIGATIFNQNYTDWDRYEAEERGERRRRRARRCRTARSSPRSWRSPASPTSTGFDSVWTIEHHFTPYTMVTNPLQYLTYIAGITENVDLGTMVVVLPWHNPVRVAEDVNMLDAFLGEGREVILGVGRGLGRREFGGLSIDQNEARGRFDESLQVLKQLLSTGRVHVRGRALQRAGRAPAPAARPTTCRRTCGAPAVHPSPSSVIAKNDVNPLIIPTTSLETSLEVAKAYIAAAPRGRPRHRAPTRSSRCGPTSPRPRTRPAPAPSSTCASTPTRRCATTRCSATTSRTSRATRPTGRCPTSCATTRTSSCAASSTRIRGARRSRRSPGRRELAEAFGTERDHVRVQVRQHADGHGPRAAWSCSPREVMPALKDARAPGRWRSPSPDRRCRRRSAHVWCGER